MSRLTGWMNRPVIQRTRRNHAIEHATVHLLSAWAPGTALGGRADSRGFYLFGTVDGDLLGEAVDAAIDRLETQPGLAIHPLCGTNVLVSGLLGGLASGLVLATLPRDRRGTADKRADSSVGSAPSEGGTDRAAPSIALPRLLLAGIFASLVGQSAGPWVQARITTSPETQGARRGEIRRSVRRGLVIHRVEIREA